MDYNLVTTKKPQKTLNLYPLLQDFFYKVFGNQPLKSSTLGFKN